jgi:hypothetical protein
MKYLFVFLLACVSHNSIGQLDIKESGTNENVVLIGEINLMTIRYMSCSKYLDSKLYSFHFKNEKYKMIEEHESFDIQGDESFNQLYDVLSNTLTKKETKELEISLDDGEILKLNFKGKGVTFWYYNGVTWSYSMRVYLKHINKLFGKVS